MPAILRISFVVFSISVLSCLSAEEPAEMPPAKIQQHIQALLLGFRFGFHGVLAKRWRGGEFQARRSTRNSAIWRSRSARPAWGSSSRMALVASSWATWCDFSSP